MIRRMLAAVRHLDQGGQVGTRALLLAFDQDIGVSALDLFSLTYSRDDAFIG